MISEQQWDNSSKLCVRDLSCLTKALVNYGQFTDIFPFICSVFLVVSHIDISVYKYIILIVVLLTKSEKKKNFLYVSYCTVYYDCKLTSIYNQQLVNTKSYILVKLGTIGIPTNWMNVNNKIF